MVLRAIFGTKHDRDIRRMRPVVQRVGELEKGLRDLDDGGLKARTGRLRGRVGAGEPLRDLIPEAFAVVREASRRVLGMRHFDVQIMGGIVLFEGKIAEMKTGEGKTLTATLPLYLHGLTGRGGHLVTVNDYLAKRDSEWMGAVYRWLGLEVGCITADMPDKDRKAAYAADVTYGTNNEFAFDYLRDNMKFDLKDYVQRDFNYCIVDEVDSILIDEARTPLLISGPSESDTRLYAVANAVIPKLAAKEHFTIDEKAHTAVITEDGIIELQKTMGIENLYDVRHAVLLHHLNQALRAHHLFKKDVNYVVKDRQVIIVDEFTGRLKEGSRWSDGLHQAIESKEGVPVKRESQTLASITFQNYFRLYGQLAGMTGTADTEAEEFQKIYNLDVVVIPTNVSVNRTDEADIVYATKQGKYNAISGLIKELYEKGQPVLVGTISIDSSEIISGELEKHGVPHEVLNAKQHRREALIIEKAGAKGAVTIATNMAGRGTDIKLTDETREAGGLFIVGTERHEARRIDNQLRGRSGRQGDPGGSKFFLSLEDDLMRIFAGEKVRKIMGTLGMKDDEPIEHRMITNSIAKAQKKVEANNFEMRKHLLKYDNVMNDQRRVIYKIRRDILADRGNVEFIGEMVEDVACMLVDGHRPERNVPIDSWSWGDMEKSFQSAFGSERRMGVDECLKKHGGDPDVHFAESAKEVVMAKFDGRDPEQVRYAVREILLSTFDQFWKNHLLAMDHVKEGVNLKAYAQKDPLTEYKREAFHLFERMRVDVKKAVVANLVALRFYTPEEMEELKRLHRAELEARLRAHRDARAREESGGRGPPGRRRAGGGKVGRNQPCPCGSGKKFKHCHGA